ncbi:RNA-dependent RNA polymerase 1 [Trichonephila clavipes]|nr:RNA-dependent RNA polymerase 1 [Trichonephila clavipes]
MQSVPKEKIKTKANIAIDPSQGRNMLGVMDETGLLNYNQVFVQYTKDISYGETLKETVILQREVLVTKNPCHLPGDVRKFQAVDIPGLHHIVDCIVFPQKGRRPHPNEMAGVTETSRNITARVIERDTCGEIYYFLENSRGFRTRQ